MEIIMEDYKAVVTEFKNEEDVTNSRFKTDILHAIRNDIEVCLIAITRHDSGGDWVDVDEFIYDSGLEVSALIAEDNLKELIEE